jgi:TPR repeat protein
MLQQNETGIQEAPSKTSVRALGADEIKLLMKQGEQFAEVGDLVTARLLFQRAAEAGDATAATALGATYDPTVIERIGVVGISADVEKARFWYQKALNLGSSDAKRRLDLLANR